jgi:hypothetical protein
MKKKSPLFFVCLLWGVLAVHSQSLDFPGTAWDAYEEDSRENPVPFGTEEETRRTLHREDEDWFLIVPSTSGLLTVETTGRLDTEMTLFLEGDSLREHDDDSGSASNARIRRMVEAGKRYIIMVKAHSDDTGPYGFKTAFSELSDSAIEPNDTRETASTIHLGKELQVFLSVSDVDWFFFTIPARGIFSGETRGNMDTLIHLFDAKGREFAADDDSGNGGNAKLSCPLNPGDYYIRVRGYDGDVGQYTLAADLRIPPGADYYEPDDTETTAKELSLNETQKRSFTGRDDVDWAFITIRTAGTYRFRADGEQNSNLDSFLAVYRGETLLGSDDDSGEGYSAQLELRLSPGTYHIRVHFLDNNPTDWYLLRAERK